MVTFVKVKPGEMQHFEGHKLPTWSLDGLDLSTGGSERQQEGEGKARRDKGEAVSEKSNGAEMEYRGVISCRVGVRRLRVKN